MRTAVSWSAVMRCPQSVNKMGKEPEMADRSQSGQFRARDSDLWPAPECDGCGWSVVITFDGLCGSCRAEQGLPTSGEVRGSPGRKRKLVAA